MNNTQEYLTDLTNFTGLFDSLNVTYEADDIIKKNVDEPRDCSSGQELYRVVADVWISLPVCVVGILGNILAFIVLYCYRHKLSTTILLQSLAIIDSMILIIVILLRTMYITYDCYRVPRYYKEPWKVMFMILFPLTYALRMMETWIITLLTFDRWIAVCKPLQAQHLCRLGATYKRIAIVIVLSFIFTFPRYLESPQWGLPESINPQWRDNNYYIYIYQLGLFFVFMYLIPTVTLIVLNLKLLLSLRVNDPTLSNRRHSKHSSSTSNPVQHRSITIIVISIVVIYFICNILALASHILFSLEFIFTEYSADLESHRRKISNISNMSITFNSASHFFIYCICSRNFRTVMYRTIGCRSNLGRFRFFRNTSRASYSNGTSDTASSLVNYHNIQHARIHRQTTTETL